MTFKKARDLAREAHRQAGAAAGQADDLAIQSLAYAVAKLAESQAERAAQLHRDM